MEKARELGIQKSVLPYSSFVSWRSLTVYPLLLINKMETIPSLLYWGQEGPILLRSVRYIFTLMMMTKEQNTKDIFPFLKYKQ